MLDKHLTDEEIQRFLLDGQQSNSKMAEHLQVCNDCKARVDTYELLFAAIAEQDRVKADVARQTRALGDIEDEARRANVPAGWLR